MRSFKKRLRYGDCVLFLPGKRITRRLELWLAALWTCFAMTSARGGSEYKETYQVKDSTHLRHRRRLQDSTRGKESIFFVLRGWFLRDTSAVKRWADGAIEVAEEDGGSSWEDSCTVLVFVA